MTKLQAKTTVTPHKSGGKIYFRTAIPRSIALDILGLATDKRKQYIKWSIKKGKVVAEKAKN